MPGFFDSEDALRTLWANPDSRDKLLKDLATVGFDQEQLDTLTEMFKAKDSDYYDLLSYLSFNKDIISRHQRVAQVKDDKAYFDGYDNDKAKKFLEFILQRYETDGIKELSREKLPHLIQLNKLGTPKEAANHFGGIQNMIEAYYNLQRKIYNKI